MMRRLTIDPTGAVALSAILAFAPGLTAQEPAPPHPAGGVRLELLSLIDDGIGAFLTLPDGSREEFHLEAHGVRSRLSNRRMPNANEAETLQPGSDAETRILRGLDAWFDQIWSPEEREHALTMTMRPPRNETETRVYERAFLLRATHRYLEVTRPKIDKIFEGRKTVTLSMRIQLGQSKPQQVLWRRIDGDAFAHMYLDTEVEPVGIDSDAENRLMLGMANWLVQKLGDRDRLWADDTRPSDQDVALVLKAYRGYLESTSPRLHGAGTIMDRGNGGSKRFEVSDAQNRVAVFRFDFRAGTKTEGRLRTGPENELIELGSEREAEALALLDRTARLQRRWLGERAKDAWGLAMLEEQLAEDRARFHQNADGKKR